MKNISVFDVQDIYKTKEERIEYLKGLTAEQVNYLINSCGTNQGKIYWSGLYKEAIHSQNRIKQITLSLSWFNINTMKRERVYTITVKSDGTVVDKRFNGDAENTIKSKVCHSVEESVVKAVFKEVEEMIPKVDPSPVKYIDDCSGRMTVTYENGEKVKLERGHEVEGESVYYKVLKELNIG